MQFPAVFRGLLALFSLIVVIIFIHRRTHYLLPACEHNVQGLVGRRPCWSVLVLIRRCRAPAVL